MSSKAGARRAGHTAGSCSRVQIMLMPPDYMERLFAGWRADAGLVASPPIGSQPPPTSWAELECAFLNAYRGAMAIYCRAPSASASRRGKTNAVGGALTCGSRRRHRVLAREVAEDAAADSRWCATPATRQVQLVDPAVPAAARLSQRRRGAGTRQVPLGATAPGKLTLPIFFPKPCRAARCR